MNLSTEGKIVSVIIIVYKNSYLAKGHIILIMKKYKSQNPKLADCVVD